MPEKFRANNSEDSGFWPRKKANEHNKHKKQPMPLAMDIISQANDVVNKCAMTNKVPKQKRNSIISFFKNGAVIILASSVIVGALVYIINTLSA